MEPLDELYEYCMDRKMQGRNVVTVDYVIEKLIRHDDKYATRAEMDVQARLSAG